jgi:hypothetical protein
MRRLSKQTEQSKTLARTSSGGAAKLFSSRILRSGIGLVLVPTPASQATPGKFYQIISGDTLFGLARKAYGVSSMERARLINNSAYNRRFWKAAPSSEQEMFPDGRISFSPRFVGDLRAQMESVKTVSAGKSFAMIWIPAEDGREPF